MAAGRNNLGTFDQGVLMRMPDVRGVLTHAQTGNIGEVKTYFRRREGQRHIEDTKALLLDRMIGAPRNFRHKADLVEIVGDQFPYQAFFKDRDGSRAAGMMTMYAKDPRPDTAKAGAMLAAEYMRAKFLDNDAVIPSFTIPRTAGNNRAALAMEVSTMANSIIATQNALVDLVEEQGRKLVIDEMAGYDSPISAAAMLFFLVPGASTDATQMWTKKIVSLDEVIRPGSGARFTVLDAKFEP